MDSIVQLGEHPVLSLPRHLDLTLGKLINRTLNMPLILHRRTIFFRFGKSASHLRHRRPELIRDHLTGHSLAKAVVMVRERLERVAVCTMHAFTSLPHLDSRVFRQQVQVLFCPLLNKISAFFRLECRVCLHLGNDLLHPDRSHGLQHTLVSAHSFFDVIRCQTCIFIDNRLEKFLRLVRQSIQIIHLIFSL